MKNSELMQEIQKLEQALPSGPDYTASGFNYTKIGDCEFPDNWKCPISLGLLIEPVHASDGFTYEKAEFEQYIAARNATNQPLLSPSTGAVLPAGALCFPANQLSSEINTLLENKLAALKKLIETIKENEKKLHALVQKGLAHKKKKEYIQAIACFKEAAEQEHAGGWYGLAMMHKYGLEFDKNPEEAKVLFNKVRSSAEKGNAFALYYLGRICEREMRSDYKKIPGYYRQAAENGIVEAMYALGHLHCDMFNIQYGVPYRDREEIIKWLTLAANAGHAEAQYELAEIYELGDDGEYACGPIIPKNDELARHYYKLAADQGHPYANQQLERMHAQTHAALKSSVAPLSSSSTSSSLQSSSSSAPVLSTNPQPSAPLYSDLRAPIVPYSSSSTALAFFNPNQQSPISLPSSNGGSTENVMSDLDIVSKGLGHIQRGEVDDACRCFKIAAERNHSTISSIEDYYDLACMYNTVAIYAQTFANDNVSVMYRPSYTASQFFTIAATNGHMGATRVLLIPKLEDYINRNGSFFLAMLNNDERNAAQHLIDKLHGLDSKRVFSAKEIKILSSGDLGKIANQFLWVARKIATGWGPEKPVTSNGNVPRR